MAILYPIIKSNYITYFFLILNSKIITKTQTAIIMIFFFFSFMASLFGAIKAGNVLTFSFNLDLSVGGPFSGIIAFWPFIVALVLLLLVVLWYQTIKNIQRKRGRSAVKQRPGLQSTVFLGLVTVFVLVLLAAPWYLQTFTEKQSETAEEDRIEMALTVHGMDCSGCEGLVNRRVGNLDGIESVAASHEREEVVVVYDKNKVSLALIAQIIEESGYTVILE